MKEEHLYDYFPVSDKQFISVAFRASLAVQNTSAWSVCLWSMMDIEIIWQSSLSNTMHHIQEKLSTVICWMGWFKKSVQQIKQLFRQHVQALPLKLSVLHRWIKYICPLSVLVLCENVCTNNYHTVQGLRKNNYLIPLKWHKYITEGVSRRGEYR